MKLIFFTNPNKPDAEGLLPAMLAAAENKGVSTLTAVGDEELEPLMDAGGGDADLVVTVGGDGTILRAVSSAAKRSIPVLGVNLGRVGFFSEIAAENFDDALEKLISGDYNIERPAMLACFVNGECYGSTLNDFSIHRQELASITHLDLFVDGDSVGDVMADGLIAATPSGSTAYTMSAGGPVVAPKLDCILVTPICPHSLTVRPIVASGDSEIRVRVKCTCRLSGDGRNLRVLVPGDEAVFKKSEITAGFVRFSKRNVFRLIREKLI